jgi:TolB-like protein/tetratricopeptide (TPR) repeat protein
MAQIRNIKTLISNPLIQTFLIYVSGGWIVLEMTDYFINHYDLSESFRDILLIILLAGLPIALILSWYLSREKLEEEQDLKATPGKKSTGLFKTLLIRPWFSIPGTVMFILIMVSLIRLVYRHSSAITDSLGKSQAEISLAVLPFTNYTGDTEQEWLVAGQHETLINELSKISQVRPLRVISRSTVNAFKNYDKPAPEIAREINVEYLVEASVLGFGDSITLQLRLIQVFPEENVVWAESCSSDFTNILKLHSGIAGRIAEKMNLDLSKGDMERLPAPREVNPESYKAYLRGMYHLNQLTPGSAEKGLVYLHEAVSIDPGEPFAYAGLALGYIEIAHGPLATDDALTKAEAAVAQAIKLDSSMAEVYSALGALYFYKFWKMDKVEEYFIKALQFNPNLAMTHYHYSWALYVMGRMEEAIAEHKLAQKYDPFNPLHTAWLGGLYCYDGQYEEAIRVAKEAFEIQKDYVISYYILGRSYLALGKTEEAIDAHKKLVEIFPLWTASLGCTYAETGQVEEAEKILNDLLESEPMIPFTAWQIVCLAAALGKNDVAFKYINRKPHHPWLVGLPVMPEYENLRDDPRFDDVIKQFNFPEKL